MWLTSHFKQLDSFRESFQWHIDKDVDRQRSIMGSCLTILFTILTLTFTYSKGSVLITKDDVKIMSVTIPGAIDSDFKFSSREGFFAAAALTEFNTDTSIIEDPRYGELTVETYRWGDQKYDNDRLNFDFCTEEELGLVQGPNTQMFPMYKPSQPDLEVYKKKFKCARRDEYEIWGDYSSAAAQQFAFNFRMCEGTTASGVLCHPKEDILEWLKAKYIVVVYNQIRFDSDSFYESAAIAESRLTYVPINTQQRE